MRSLTKLIGRALLAWAAVMPFPSPAPAQQPAAPKRVLALLWYDKDYPANVKFEQEFQAALRSGSHDGVEYYSEYLETNRFPGENQSLYLRDYLRKKYAGHMIDVVVARASPPLEFLLKYRSELFPHTPIVFASERQVVARTISESGATGIVYASNYSKTLDLALKLHPRTEQLFVISGTLTHDKSLESLARKELERYKNKVAITYLTDLPPEQLKAKLSSLPNGSVGLYVWQQARNQQGRLLETHEILPLIAQEARVPIYGMSASIVGLGIVGGYVWTFETMAGKLAAITLRVANGARAADVPVERAPEVPVFDWRQLQRWGISENRLPPDSVIQFRELTFWQLYKWRVAGAIVVFALQALLIGALLLERRMARRTRLELQEYKEELERLVQQRTAELVEARDQALAANRSKSTFLANMSHELRTPLNAILGFSGMVLRDASLSAQNRKDLAIVGSSGEHLLGLIDDILDTAKIETGGSVLECESIDLQSLVNDTVNMLRERAQTKNLELFLDISSQAPRFVRSDPRKLRQVLTNLVGNALKYTDEGSVVVRLDARTSDAPSGSVLLFDVEDTGIGIAEDDQVRIFDPFIQAGSARTRNGTGLGLAISRHFVHLMGGTIQVESTLGRGSRFHVEVPAQTAEASEVAAGNSGEEQVAGLEPGQPDYRVLIVEDQRENRLLMQRLLQTAGFRVRVAEDGEQAVEAFKLWRPHFIWMDLRLPVLGGLEAARLIRELEAGREVKIVAVTASAFASQREEVLANGFDDFLLKPYRTREIFDCMARHLGVGYVYGAGKHAVDEHLPSTLRPADLATLPATLRDELESAVISLNRERIARVIRQITEQNAFLGSMLAPLAERFAYTPIFVALEGCKKTFTAGS